MTDEEIIEKYAEPLERLDETSEEFLRTLESICTGHGSIGELDDAYKTMKNSAKELNRLGKAWFKNHPEG